MIYTGSNEILGIKLGDTDISAIYAGDLLIYPTTVTGWSVNPTSFEVKSSSGSVTIRITSLSAWTITSSESWITFSQNSGDSGRTTVIATYEENVGDSDRTATITASDGTNVTTISFLQSKYAALPGPFIFNYNAKQYVSSTKTLLKTEGQSLNQDLTFGAASVTANTENGYLTINNNRIVLDFNSAANNPFNRYNNATGRSLTIVYKTSGNFSNTLFGNRGRQDNNTGDYYNYMVRETVFHTADSNFLRMTATTSPYVMYVRINADGTSERKCVTTGQIVTASSVDYGNAPRSCAFFGGGASISEPYAGNFYWMYCSLETLTDADIRKVIDYNENL